VTYVELVQATVFSYDDRARELQGILDQMVLPILIVTIIAWPGVRFWAKDIEWQIALAVSLTIGVLLVAIGYLLFLIIYLTVQDGSYSITAIAYRTALLSVFFLPVIIILGPIVIVCLVRARHGGMFLSALALCGVSVFCVVLQYFWLGYFLSG
jgi:hypothetical protein